jgi:PTH1 family peptidyl-tRNA hydrolase
MKQKKLVIGLGNPGKKYAHNRHNAGFRCIEFLAKKNEIQIKRSQCQSKVDGGTIAGIDTVLAKPHTFVNCSGVAVKGLMQKYRIPVEDIIIICDDLDLPAGKIRIRQNGGSGGHNGLKSIIADIGSQDFCRVKVGIGRPQGEQNVYIDEDAVISYVLGDFTPDEMKLIEPAVIRAVEAIECILAEGVTAAMNKFN